LEALSREHLVKCVCVSSEHKDTCYEGGFGLKPGQKWCEWHSTPSWRKLLAEASGGMTKDLPKAECTEFPLGPNPDENNKEAVMNNDAPPQECQAACRKQYCIGNTDFTVKISSPDFKDKCKAFVTLKAEACDSIRKAEGNIKKHVAIMTNKTKCDNHKAEIEISNRNIEHIQTHGSKIKKATKACELEVLSVCQKSSCPSQNMIQKTKGINCEEKCKSVVKTAFRIGEIECDEDEDWADCQRRHNEELEKSGRDVALEALSREHLVKCVCVSSEHKDTCYEGGLGLKRGQKWCEWNNTPSWRKLLAEASGGMKKDLPKAECTEFPPGPSSDKNNNMAA